MDKKVWVVEYDDGSVKVYSTEGSAYRQILQSYAELLSDDLANIRDGKPIEITYENIISDLKNLACKHYIEGLAYITEAELIE